MFFLVDPVVHVCHQITVILAVPQLEENLGKMLFNQSMLPLKACCDIFTVSRELNLIFCITVLPIMSGNRSSIF